MICGSICFYIFIKCLVFLNVYVLLCVLVGGFFEVIFYIFGIKCLVFMYIKNYLLIVGYLNCL